MAPNKHIIGIVAITGFIQVLIPASIIILREESASSTTDSSGNQTMPRSVVRKIANSVVDSYVKTFLFLEDLPNRHLRKELLHNAKGEVLEVASGTGRNLEFYPEIPVSKITVTDHRKRTLEQLQKTVVGLQKEAKRNLPQFSLEVADVHNMKYPDSSFDTVVDTFGICSFEDPTAALREMQRVCKKDGKVLLLEHGLGKATIVNNYLNYTAPEHAQPFGCWHNRDILKHVEEAGLQIEKVSRHHCSTKYCIVASPNPKLKEEEREPRRV